jgi:hypothetical protein
MWDNVGPLIQRLDILLCTPGAFTLAEQPSLLAAVGAILVRLESIEFLHIHVLADAPAASRSILSSIQFMASKLKTFHLEWYPGFDDAYRLDLMNGLRRHSATLTNIDLYCDMSTTLLPRDLDAFENIVDLTLGRFDIVRDHFPQGPTCKPWTRLRLADLDSSVDFQCLCAVILPLIPNVRSLVFYLVHPVTPIPLVPLPSLDHLRRLEIRSVGSLELDDCLLYFAPLPALEELIVSADSATLVDVTDTLVDHLTGERHRELGDPTGEPPRPFPRLRLVEVQYEGDDGMMMVDDLRDGIAAAIANCRVVLGARKVRVRSPSWS